MINPAAALLAATVAVATSAVVHAKDTAPPRPEVGENVRHLRAFEVVELRRYTVKEGERAHFATYFESYFPEAFEQLGAIVFGQFLERGNPDRFTWLRGYHDLGARPIVNSAFYYGPLWKEHRARMNAILPDSDNVLLMRPLRPELGVAVLPAVDPVVEHDGAHGIVVAQIFAIVKGDEDAFAAKAESAFARYAIDGVQQAGVLVSLDVPNNFPQLPIRTDGPFLAWIGIVKDDATLESRLRPQLLETARALTGTKLLRGEPELVVMDPTTRSRLRWLEGGARSAPSN